MTGTRFDGGRLPVDSLIELQKYQEIVRIAAEAKWKQDHPGENFPEDLRQSVSLTIDSINEGSADVFLAFEQHQEYVQYQEEARNRTDSALVAAYSGSAVSEPFEFRSKIAEIGITLQDGQTIEYYPDNAENSPITISVDSRAQALDSLLAVDDFLISPEIVAEPAPFREKTEASLVGKITALDTDSQTYRLTLPDGQQLKGRYKNNPDLLDDLRQVVNDSEEGPLTRVSGTLQKKNGELSRFWETTKIEQVQFDDTDWGQRLTIFASLPPDWDDAGAEQISPIALDAAQIVLRSIREAGIERPGVFPTAEGGVLLEWGTSKSVVSIEFLDDGSFETFSLQNGQKQGDHSSGTNLNFAIETLKAAKA